ncbi:MAG: tetratricopeptide repeat protein [Lachnospiraceae bacterium]|nr:tetratricopeptide repeat protein [Lachnospiraceae bacterium]
MRKGKGMAVLVLLAALLCAQGCESAGRASNEEGIAAYQAGELNKAIGLFNQAITQDSSCAEYYVNKGMALSAMTDYENALICFEQAVNLDSGLAHAYRGKGITCSREKDYPAAIAAFDQALACIRDQKSSLACDIIGYRAAAKTLSGDYDGAIADYETLIACEYEKERMYLLLGHVYIKKQDVDLATIQYQNSINQNHKDLKKYLEMAETLEAAGFEEERLRVLEAALSLTADTDEKHYDRGVIYLELDQVKEAFAEFEQAYNMGYLQAGYYLGYCYELWEQYSEAELIYQKQLTVSAQDARIYNQLAVCQLKQQKYQEALVMINQGLALNDQAVSDDLLWNRVVCYEKMREYASAMTTLEEYLVKFPSDEKAKQELSYLRSR